MYALAIHGGAGATPTAQLSATQQRDYLAGLERALAAGQRILAAGGPSLEAVEAAVVVLEDDPLFNAGRGAVLAADGAAELDAAIMDGRDLRAGAVAAVRQVRNPVRLARAVMERSAHVLLVADGAERFASEHGLERVANEYFVTPERRAELAAQTHRPSGTVGAVARDEAGHLAAATSTGGMSGKHVGRVGDSPLIGAGTYADDSCCAVSTTGHGEWFIRTVVAYDILARLRYGGMSLAAAVEASIDQRLRALGAEGGLIAVDREGNLALRFNSPAMFRGSVSSTQPAGVWID